MTKLPRENRVPIMMSSEELEAIDEWRFKNRIATRSDAIRRLAKMALVLEDHRSSLVAAHAARGDAEFALLEAIMEMIGKAIDARTTGPDENRILDLVSLTSTTGTAYSKTMGEIFRGINAYISPSDNIENIHQRNADIGARLTEISAKLAAVPEASE